MEVINLATREKQDEIISKLSGLVDLGNTTGKLVVTTNSHESRLIVDITGSGFLTGVINGANITKNVAYTIEVDDNGEIFRLQMPPGGSFPMLIRFNNRLLVKSSDNLDSSGMYQCSYILD